MSTHGRSRREQGVAHACAWRAIVGLTGAGLACVPPSSGSVASGLVRGAVAVALLAAGLGTVGSLGDDEHSMLPDHWSLEVTASLLWVTAAYLGVQVVTSIAGSWAATYVPIYAAAGAVAALERETPWPLLAVPGVGLEWLARYAAGTAPTALVESGGEGAILYAVGIAAATAAGRGLAMLVEGRDRASRRSPSAGDGRSELQLEGQTGREDRSTVDLEEAAVEAPSDPESTSDGDVAETLSLAHRALEAHTTLLLWFDRDRESLSVREALGEGADALAERVDPARGVVASLIRADGPVTLNDLRPDFPGLVYYDDPPAIAHFAGLPIDEGGHTRGLLCVDRRVGAPFDDDDLEVLGDLQRSLRRSLYRARKYSDVEAENVELERFLRASRRLNGVLTPDEVLEAALHGASDVLTCDVVAVTTREEEEDIHRIAAIEGREHLSASLEVGWTFEGDGGLVASVVKNEHYLPVESRIDDVDPVVFEGTGQLDTLRSLLILPLVAQDRAIGTLIVGRTRPEPITQRQREMLEVIANQVAVSLQNARLYAEMETLATTDELTGLPNRRTFEERLEEAVARHRRGERSLGVIMLDIDHFKSINDTYGHAVGDRVLEQLGDVLESSVRTIDVPARYGGEEFVVLLEEAELEDACMVAERIRSDIEALEFATESGSFSCTVSLGVAIWPHDARDRDELVECADQALYASKESGRNQVTAHTDLGAETSQAPGAKTAPLGASPPSTESSDGP